MASSTWLNPGEKIVAEVRPHWSFLGRPLVAVVVMLSVGIAAVVEKVSQTFDTLLAVAMGVTLVWLMARYARWSTTVMTLTNERLVRRRGLFGRGLRDIPLTQIGEIDCRRRVRDRLMGSGDVVVTSASSGKEVFERLPRPTAVVRDLHRQVDLARRTGRAPSGSLSPAEQLDHLEELRRRRAISQTEFENRRSQLRRTW